MLILPKEPKSVSPLLSFVPDVESCCETAYLSLTAKFLDLADSIESGAYSTSDTEHGKVLSINTSKICRKRRVCTDSDDWIYLE